MGEGIGLDEEQGRQGCEQEAKRQGQEERVLCGCQAGACRPEDQGLVPHQEGHPALPEGEGALQEVSYRLAASCERRPSEAQLRVWGFPHPFSEGASSSDRYQSLMKDE